jgi:hypothetical protein
VRVKAEALTALCKVRNLNILITDTLRTQEEQQALYAKGRTAPGSVVTNARGLESPHCWGVAFDFCENVKGHEYDDATFFERVGELGQSIGLCWGGNFKGFVDMPHFEDDDFLPGHSTVTLRAHYKTFDEFRATWPAQEETAVAQLIGATIPFDLISKVEIYENNGRKTLAEAMSVRGAHLGMNLGFYNMSNFLPCATETWIDSVQKCKGDYPGYAFSNAKVTWCNHNSVKAPHFIGGYPALIQDGQHYNYPTNLGIDDKVDRGRSGIGIVPTGLHLAVMKDTSGITDFTIAELEAYFRALGAANAINVDGGGSSQGRFGGNRVVSSSRKVANYLLVTIKIKPTVRKGAKGDTATYLQKALMRHKYALPKYGADGAFGTETETVVKKFQRDYGLTADGIVGPLTWTVLETLA